MVETKATITCPHCGNNEELEMPTNFCQIIYKCPNCGKTLTPKEEDCCVFCSYADKKRPPIQEENKKR